MATISNISSKRLEIFEDVLSDIVNADGSADEKKEELEELLSPSAQTDIEELASWFD